MQVTTKMRAKKKVKVTRKVITKATVAVVVARAKKIVITIVIMCLLKVEVKVKNMKGKNPASALRYTITIGFAKYSVVNVHAPRYNYREVDSKKIAMRSSGKQSVDRVSATTILLYSTPHLRRYASGHPKCALVATINSFF